MYNINFRENVPSDLLKACCVNMKGLGLTFQFRYWLPFVLQRCHKIQKAHLQVTPGPPRISSRIASSLRPHPPFPRPPTDNWGLHPDCPWACPLPISSLPLPPTKALLSLPVLSQLKVLIWTVNDQPAEPSLGIIVLQKSAPLTPASLLSEGCVRRD